jgi:hypothetical protein
MVGGTMLGYSEIGKRSMLTTPRSTMMIAMTLARIGRSMKNLDTARPFARP